MLSALIATMTLVPMITPVFADQSDNNLTPEIVEITPRGATMDVNSDVPVSVSYNGETANINVHISGSYEVDRNTVINANINVNASVTSGASFKIVSCTKNVAKGSKSVTVSGVVTVKYVRGTITKTLTVDYSKVV